jgi:quinoprotein dehydrogenase-associated probable ABC transporter substrate-binding protein
MYMLSRSHLALSATLLLLGAPALAAQQRPAPMQEGLLRVCADPDNLPSSDSTGAGFENKLAELMAKTWNAKLQYTWWAAPRGIGRMLNGKYCDVMLQAPAGYEIAGLTRPYYRTSYAFVQRKDAPHMVTSLDDPALKQMKIGVHLFANDQENAPPAMALSAHGVVGNLVGFGTAYYGVADRPSKIIEAVRDKEVDIAIVWGPIAGFYNVQLKADLALTAIENDTVSRIPFAYSMAMGTRRGEPQFRDSLQKFLDTKGPEIQALLEEFGVPLLPLPPGKPAH